MKVVGIDICTCKVPLTTPYPLSFTTVKEIDSVVVRIGLDDGSIGIGEAVPLPGYAPETFASILHDLQSVNSLLIGKEMREIVALLDELLPDSPFAMSAILTAIEMAEGAFVFAEKIDLPLVAPVSSSSNSDLTVAAMRTWYEKGYRTIKLKVGRNIDHDCRCLTQLILESPKNIKIRVDANQGYSLNEACQLLRVLEHDQDGIVEVIEQPFNVVGWSVFGQLAHKFPSAPLMLDESILDDDDIDRAVQYGAKFIKLKLFKHRGPSHVSSLIRRAVKAHLGVVFGNGVCSPIGNLIEASIFQNLGLCFGAFEGNGFEKLAFSTVLKPPQVYEGSMVWNLRSAKSISELFNIDLYSVVERKGWL